MQIKNNSRVLIADESLATALSISLQLKKYGVNTPEISNNQFVLHRQLQEETYDFLIIDSRLYTPLLMKLIRKDNIPTVFLTPFGSLDFQSKVLKNSCVIGYFSKPLDHFGLYSVLRWSMQHNLRKNQINQKP